MTSAGKGTPTACTTVKQHDPTICGRCKKGKLVKEIMWGGTAVYWYCLACLWINRWRRVNAVD